MNHFVRIAKQFSIARVAGLVALMMALAFTAAVAQAQTYTVLHNFGVTDPTFPGGQVTQARDGNLYGIVGTGTPTVIYKTTTAGVTTVLANTIGPPGTTSASCATGMILGTDGNLYGTCYQVVPAYPGGAVFQYVPGAATVTVLAGFAGSATIFPGPLVQAADGNFYGLTQLGGTSGIGIAYKMTPAGVMTTLHNFVGAPTEPSDPTPVAPLIQAKDGNFYGSATTGCSFGNNSGCVFKMTPAGAVTIVSDLNGTGSPYSGVIQGTDGNLYGATQLNQPGATNQGTVYKATTGGGYALLHAFNRPVDFGGYPVWPLIQATDGNLYGTAVDCYAGGCDTANIFKSTTHGAYTTLVTLSPSPCTLMGCLPNSPLTQHTNGTFYGVTQQGGSAGNGTFYSLTLSPALNAFVSLQQKSGTVGSTVDILGQGFTGATAVKFGGVRARFTAVSDTFLTAIVPIGALTGTVTVTEASGILTSAQTFSVKARITTFTPTSGPVGTLVTINGSGLTQVTAVTFNKVSAAFTVVSDSKITATVPTGATTGKIAVTNPAGTTTSASSFTVN